MRLIYTYKNHWGWTKPNPKLKDQILQIWRKSQFSWFYVILGRLGLNICPYLSNHSWWEKNQHFIFSRSNFIYMQIEEENHSFKTISIFGLYPKYHDGAPHVWDGYMGVHLHPYWGCSWQNQCVRILIWIVQICQPLLLHILLLHMLLLQPKYYNVYPHVWAWYVGIHPNPYWGCAWQNSCSRILIRDPQIWKPWCCYTCCCYSDCFSRF